MVALTAAAATAAKVIAGLIAADIGVLGLTASDSQRLASKAHDKFYAGLKAEGYTTIDNVHLIDRGYFKIEDDLTRLGAKIKRIKD